MHACESCGGEYTSALAAAQCEDDDREQDRNTREWFNHKGHPQTGRGTNPTHSVASEA